MSETIVKQVQEKYDEKVKKADEAKKPVTLEIEPVPFPVHTQGFITNTKDIIDRISEAFGLMRDYVGCRVYPYVPGLPIPKEIIPTMSIGHFYCDVYFEMGNNNAGIENLELVNSSSADKKTDPLSVLNRVCSGSSNSTTYRLTKQTLDILAARLPGYVPGDNRFNPQWSSRIVEDKAYVNNFSNIEKVVVKVIGLDVDSIMGTIYGIYDEDSKEEDSSKRPIKYDYHCVALATSAENRVYFASQSSADQVYNTNYVIQVLRNDRRIISAMQRAIGISPNNYANSYVPYSRKR